MPGYYLFIFIFLVCGISVNAQNEVISILQSTDKFTREIVKQFTLILNESINNCKIDFDNSINILVPDLILEDGQFVSFSEFNITEFTVNFENLYQEIEVQKDIIENDLARFKDSNAEKILTIKFNFKAENITNPFLNEAEILEFSLSFSHDNFSIDYNFNFKNNPFYENKSIEFDFILDFNNTEIFKKHIQDNFLPTFKTKLADYFFTGKFNILSTLFPLNLSSTTVKYKDIRLTGGFPIFNLNLSDSVSINYNLSKGIRFNYLNSSKSDNEVIVFTPFINKTNITVASSVVIDVFQTFLNDHIKNLIITQNELPIKFFNYTKFHMKIEIIEQNTKLFIPEEKVFRSRLVLKCKFFFENSKHFAFTENVFVDVKANLIFSQGKINLEKLNFSVYQLGSKISEEINKTLSKMNEDIVRSNWALEILDFSRIMI